MPKKIDIEDILKQNPQVDPSKLKEGIELSEKLKEMGFTRKGYDLATPEERRKAHAIQPSSTRHAVQLPGSNPC